ncbi:hypothetical protein [Streptomyces sp. YKOK-I1]
MSITVPRRAADHITRSAASTAADLSLWDGFEVPVQARRGRITLSLHDHLATSVPKRPAAYPRMSSDRFGLEAGVDRQQEDTNDTRKRLRWPAFVKVCPCRPRRRPPRSDRWATVDVDTLEGADVRLSVNEQDLRHVTKGRHEVAASLSLPGGVNKVTVTSGSGATLTPLSPVTAGTAINRTRPTCTRCASANPTRKSRRQRTTTQTRRAR